MYSANTTIKYSKYHIKFSEEYQYILNFNQIYFYKKAIFKLRNIDRISENQGFSESNTKNMRQFYGEWNSLLTRLNKAKLELS